VLVAGRWRAPPAAADGERFDAAMVELWGTSPRAG
jgi:hypothetical protein